MKHDNLGEESKNILVFIAHNNTLKNTFRQDVEEWEWGVGSGEWGF
ncbi:hypothetical protein [Nostoc sp.]